DSKIVIKTRIKTLPLHQWATARELRRRIKNAFDRYNIEIPFPHMSIYFGKESRPVELMLRNAEKALASEK
ncbi:MAG: mechanosensitive ion channel family protein, partial [Acidobacteria bacterium]|nr:mechanosensitive ion channel family protein [Acidobacteriota bacterium]